MAGNEGQDREYFSSDANSPHLNFAVIHRLFLQVWEDKAAKAKEQYTKDLEAFNANGGGGEPKKAAKRGKKAAKKPAIVSFHSDRSVFLGC